MCLYLPFIPKFGGSPTDVICGQGINLCLLKTCLLLMSPKDSLNICWATSSLSSIMIIIQMWKMVYKRWISFQKFPLRRERIKYTEYKRYSSNSTQTTTEWKSVTLPWMQMQGKNRRNWFCVFQVPRCKSNRTKQCALLRHEEAKDSLNWAMQKCTLPKDFSKSGERMKESKAKQAGGRELNPRIEFYFI